MRELDGVRVGGVGGVIGNPDRNQRKPADVFARSIERVFAMNPDLLVIHEGPDVQDERLVGSPLVRETLERLAARPRARLPLVACGHSWWPVALATLADGLQVLKVDARVVVLLRA